mgnify:CR=1 FL=1
MNFRVPGRISALDTHDRQHIRLTVVPIAVEDFECGGDGRDLLFVQLALLDGFAALSRGRGRLAAADEDHSEKFHDPHQQHENAEYQTDADERRPQHLGPSPIDC